MSAKWSDKGEKDPPLVSDDEFMILDSEVISPSTKNKRVTLSTVQANVVIDIDVNGFSLSDAVLETPTIADFTNAVHNHSNALGGGQLTNIALSTGVFSAITGIGTQTQILDMGTTNQIKNVEDPTDSQDAVTKNYVDTGTAIWTKSGTNIFPTTLTDRVGLGLSAPEATLHIRSLAVTGDITVDGDSDDLFIENQGNVGYDDQDPPTVTIAPPPDTVTTAGTAVLGRGIEEVTTNLPSGTGYEDGELLELTGNSSFANDARGLATLTGEIDAATVANPGTGYTDGEPVTLTGQSSGAFDATATVSEVSGPITAINITAGGTGYQEGETVDVIGGTGSGGTGTVTLTGEIASIEITVRGSGYDTDELVNIVGLDSGATNATATSTTTQFVTSITITNSGSGYVTEPEITIESATGFMADDAEAVAVLVNTEVTTINITNTGNGYTEVPAVTFTLAPDAETAMADVDDIVGGKVVSVLVTNGGIGYKVPPSVVTFSGGTGNGVGVDTVTVANSSIQSITVTNGGAGLTIISEPDQVGVIGFTTGGTTTTTEKILFDHSTERMRFIVDSVQGLIIDNLGHVAISQDNATHAQVFTVDTDVLNVPVRILIRDDTDRLMLGYNGSDNFVTDAIQAQVIVQTDSPDLSIASCGAEASNLRFYTSDVSGLEERMIITNEGRVGVDVVNPLRIFQVGDQANPSTGIMRFAHKTGTNFRSWDVGVGEIATFGTNDTFGIIDVGHAESVFVIRATSGNVGMGITIPAAKLHVVGTTGVKFEGGALDMTTQRITNVVDPTANQDAATKNYVDNVSGIGVQAQDLNMGTNRINNVVNPSADQDAATKNYVDGIALGLSWKEPVRAATTASITLSTNQTIDGVAVVTDDRVLVKDQGSGSPDVDNGIYIVAVGAWARSADMAATSDAVGAAMFVSEGTVNEGDSFVQNQDPATVDTNALLFVQITGLNPISLDDLTDVTITGNTTDDLLVSDVNGAWVNRQGVFDGITGLGIQTVDLDMGLENILDVVSMQLINAGFIRWGTAPGLVLVGQSTRLELDIASVDEYAWNATQAEWNGNDLVDVGNLEAVQLTIFNQGSGADPVLTSNATNQSITLAGSLDMDSSQINNVAEPTSAQDAATKNYVDINSGATELDELTDVTITGTTTNDLLTSDFDGAWINRQGIFAGITGLGLQSQNMIMNAHAVTGVTAIQMNSTSSNIQWDSGLSTDVLSFPNSTFTITIDAITKEYEFDATDADFHGNNIINVGLVQFDDVDTTLVQSDTDLQYDVATTGIHQFRINDVSELEIADTTINAPTATFQENGTNISPIGLHDVYLDAGGFIPVDSGSLTTRIIGATTNQKAITFIPFLTGVDTFATIKFKLPRNYNNDTITAVINWTTQTEGTGTVIWGVSGVAVADGDDIAVAYGTEIPVTDTQLTINFSQDSPRTTAITLGNTPANADTIYLKIQRLGASDTFGEDAQLLGVWIEITTDAAVSA